MKLSDNVYMLDSAKGSFVYLVRGEETVLIDTGMPFRKEAIIRELQDMGALEEIRHILITHHDYDHIGNLYALQCLTGARVWASAEDIPYIRGELDRSSFKKYLKYIFKTKIPEQINPFIPGEAVSGIEIIPTPGHTPGHVCLQYQEMLFVGDLFENKDGKLRIYPKAWNWNNDLMQESAKKAAERSAKWICPAHGLPVEGNYNL